MFSLYVCVFVHIAEDQNEVSDLNEIWQVSLEYLANIVSLLI